MNSVNARHTLHAIPFIRMGRNFYHLPDYILYLKIVRDKFRLTDLECQEMALDGDVVSV